MSSAALRSLLVGALVGALAGLSWWAAADGDPATDDVPRVLAYRGFLELDGAGADEPVDVRFTLYADGGDPVWTEEHSAALGRPVAVRGGRFSLLLGRYEPLAEVARDAEPLELGLEVRLDGTWVSLTRREPILPTAYALWSRYAADFDVWRDLSVAGAADVTGTLNAESLATTGAEVHVQGDLTLDGRLLALDAVPSGTVAFFDLPEGTGCPRGWSEFSAGRGRTLVGIAPGGTVAGTVGTGLTDLEARTHTHTVDVVATSTSSDGAHTHSIDIDGAGGSTSTYLENWGQAGVNTSGSAVRSHSHTVNVEAGTSSSDGAHSHTFDPPLTSMSVAAGGDILPYVQLLLCRRN